MSKLNLLTVSKIRPYTDDNSVSSLVASLGCSLRCAYCINPESWDGSVKSNFITVDELYEKVRIYNLYYLATGGGIIFGGGEPLLYHEFIKEFIEKYNSTGWKFTLESCLNVKNSYLKNIIDSIDSFIIDIKDMDKFRYEFYTKGEYKVFIKNLEYLIENVDSSRVKVRIPRIENFHNFNEYKSSYKLVKSMGFKNIEVFDYIEPEKVKNTSIVAKLNKFEFINRLKN